MKRVSIAPLHVVVQIFLVANNSEIDSLKHQIEYLLHIEEKKPENHQMAAECLILKMQKLSLYGKAWQWTPLHSFTFGFKIARTLVK